MKRPNLANISLLLAGTALALGTAANVMNTYRALKQYRALQQTLPNWKRGASIPAEECITHYVDVTGDRKDDHLLANRTKGNLEFLAYIRKDDASESERLNSHTSEESVFGFKVKRTYVLHNWTNIPCPPTATATLILGDLNGDGKPDMKITIRPAPQYVIQDGAVRPNPNTQEYKLINDGSGRYSPGK